MLKKVDCKKNYKDIWKNYKRVERKFQVPRFQSWNMPGTLELGTLNV